MMTIDTVYTAILTVRYENTMSEWLAVEAIVRQRDKETQANAIAKLSSESVSGDQVPTQIQRDLSNDVSNKVFFCILLIHH